MGLEGEIEDKMMDWLTGDFGVQVSVCVFVEIWGACQCLPWTFVMFLYSTMNVCYECVGERIIVDGRHSQ